MTTLRLWWLGVALATAAVGQVTQSQPVSHEERLWRQIIQARQCRRHDGEPYERYLQRLLPAKRRELELTEAYLSSYPGGRQRDAAARRRLQLLFEIGTLTGGQYRELCAAIRQDLQHPLSPSAADEAAYWALICGRVRAGDPTSLPAGGALPAADDALLAALRDYVGRFPHGRYVPRAVEVLFAQAERTAALEEMQSCVRRLERDFADHPLTAQLAGRLRRWRLRGRVVPLALYDRDGRTLELKTLRGRQVLIVVWAAFDEKSVDCLQSVARYVEQHPRAEAVGVDIDVSCDEMRLVCRKTGVTFEQFNDGRGWAGEFLRYWGIKRIPFVMVLDAEGRLVDWAEGADCRGLLERLEASPAPTTSQPARESWNQSETLPSLPARSTGEMPARVKPARLSAGSWRGHCLISGFALAARVSWLRPPCGPP